MDITEHDMVKILSLVPEWNKDKGSIIMTDLPCSENYLIFNSKYKIDLLLYAQEIYNEIVIIYDKANDKFIRQDNGSRFRLLPNPLKPVKTFSYKKNKVIFFKITGLYTCIWDQDGLITKYHFVDKQTFIRCIDYLHTSKKYKLVGNYHVRILARKYDFCPLCDPDIDVRIDKWYNCGLWKILKECGVDTCDSKDSIRMSTFEEFITNDNEYYCDTCDICDGGMSYSALNIYHCSKCLLDDISYNVCFKCYEQNKHLEHEKISGHKLEKNNEDNELLYKF